LEFVDVKMSGVFLKAEYNKVRKEVMGWDVQMLIGVLPKHQLTLFHVGMLKMVLRSGTSQHPTQGNKEG